jgi:1-acyl-sn-glycerol-3-phosphate acyltransferase
MSGLSRRVAYHLLERTLRRTFRRIVWVGDLSPPPRDRPVVLLANHHLFHDAQVLGWLIACVLRRRGIVWMEELDRFPFLAPLGPLPFPAADPARRSATIRRTIRAMRDDPGTVLLYFPEGALHDADEGMTPFPASRLTRLQRALPAASWWPVALRLGGSHEARPIVWLTGAEPQPRVRGTEREILKRLLRELETPADGQHTVLLEGAPGAHERWDFSAFGRLFLPRS